MILLVGFVSAECFEHEHREAFSRICTVESDNAILFYCEADNNLLYLVSVDSECNEHGCPGTLSSSDSYLYVLSEGNNQVCGICWNKYSLDQYWAWSSSSLCYDIDYSSGGDPSDVVIDEGYDSCCLSLSSGKYYIKESCDPVGNEYFSVVSLDYCASSESSGVLSFFEKIWNWIKSFFRSLGLGSVSSSAYGGNN